MQIEGYALTIITNSAIEVTKASNEVIKASNEVTFT